MFMNHAYRTVVVAALFACTSDSDNQYFVSTLRPDSTLTATFVGDVPKLAPEDAPRDTLQTSRVFGNDTTFGIVGPMRVVGDYLILGDWLIDPHLVVIDRNSGLITERFGRHGRGPGEFLRPYWISPDTDRGAWIFDVQLARLTRVDLRARPARITRETNFMTGVMISSPIVLDSSIIAGAFLADEALVRFGLDGGAPQPIAVDQPFDAESIPQYNPRRILNRSHLAVNPSRTHLALAYQSASRIDFYTLSGQRYGTVSGPRPSRPSYRIVRNGETISTDATHVQAYVAVDATDSFVFALFQGRPKGDSLRPDRIHVFGWNGQFMSELALDQHVYRIAVSPDGAILYGMVGEPYPSVVEWPLPEALRSK